MTYIKRAQLDGASMGFMARLVFEESGPGPSAIILDEMAFRGQLHSGINVEGNSALMTVDPVSGAGKLSLSIGGLSCPNEIVHLESALLASCQLLKVVPSQIVFNKVNYRETREFQVTLKSFEPSKRLIDGQLVVRTDARTCSIPLIVVVSSSMSANSRS